MTANSEVWTCEDAADCVIDLARQLRQERIADWNISADNTANILTKCSACGKGNRNPRKCHGWRLAFRGPTAIRFSSVAIKDRFVHVEISSRFDYTRDQPYRTFDEWLRSPMRDGTGAILVRDADTEMIISRQHFDLANAPPGGTPQLGPVWHLQLGGLPGPGGARPDYEWLDVPRWPTAPIDFVLLVELALYSFGWESWCRLKKTGSWQDLIHHSEELMLGHYYHQLHNYWQQRKSSESWLAYQCNRSGRWRR